MNKKELRGAFSMVQTPEELTQAVLSAQRAQRKPGAAHRWIWRAAACAAAVAILLGALLFWPAQGDTEEPGIIAVPGVLKVYAYEGDLSSNQEGLLQYELGNAISSQRAIWCPFLNVVGFGIPLVFDIPEGLWGDASVSYNISVEYGYFLDSKVNPRNLGSEISISNGERVYWQGQSILEIADEVGENGNFYADVVIYADGNIVGYGVISFVYTDHACIAYELKTMCFPLVDNQFQNVSEEYVMELIEACK